MDELPEEYRGAVTNTFESGEVVVPKTIEA